MEILLTNDDGFNATGINSLYGELSKEHSTTIVAPKNQQSGVGQSFTLYDPLFVTENSISDGTIGYSVSGSPSDCVKIGLCSLLDNKPDVVVSGINDGKNAGIASFYSGTVAAAREAAFWRIPGVAFSLHEKATEYLELYAQYSLKVLNVLTSNITDSKTLYNVNFPNCHPKESKGIKITRQSMGYYKDRYEVKENNGQKEYWIRGEMVEIEKSLEYDFYALEQGYVTITPLTYDTTAFLDENQILNIEKLDIKESL